MVARPVFPNERRRRFLRKMGHFVGACGILLLIFLAWDRYSPVEHGSSRSDLKRSCLNFGAAVAVMACVAEVVDRRRQQRLEAAPAPVFQRQWIGTWPASAVYCALLVILYQVNPAPGLSSALAVLLLPLSFAKLRPIELTAGEVAQANGSGGATRLAYSEIHTITFDDDGNTSVIGTGGTIVHTHCHLAPEVFRAWISHLSGQPVSGPNGHIAQGVW